jgi:hypothetical protein
MGGGTGMSSAKAYFKTLAQELAPWLERLEATAKEEVLELQVQDYLDQFQITRAWEFPFAEILPEGAQDLEVRVSSSIRIRAMELNLRASVNLDFPQAAGPYALGLAEIAWFEGQAITDYMGSNDPRILTFLGEVLVRTVQEAVLEREELIQKAKASPEYREAEAEVLTKVALSA